jgi:hypothetical protein
LAAQKIAWPNGLPYEGSGRFIPPQGRYLALKLWYGFHEIGCDLGNVKREGLRMPVKTPVLIIILMLVSACAASLNIEKLQEFDANSRTLVLTDGTRWDAKLRVALTKAGFKTLKYSSVETVVSEGNNDEIARVYDEATAQYGLTFYWEQVDRCIYNSSKLINGTFEITDLKSNEVLLVIEKGGWTGPCLDPRGMVFTDLAEALSSVWDE